MPVFPGHSRRQSHPILPFSRLRHPSGSSDAPDVNASWRELTIAEENAQYQQRSDRIPPTGQRRVLGLLITPAQRRFSAPRCRRSDRAQTPCLSGLLHRHHLCPRSCGRQARPLVPGGVIGQLVLEGDLRLCRQRPIADLCHRRSAKTPQGYWAAALLRRADALASATSRFGSAFPGNVAHPAFITKSVWS